MSSKLATERCPLQQLTYHSALPGESISRKWVLLGVLAVGSRVLVVVVSGSLLFGSQLLEHHGGADEHEDTDGGRFKKIG